MGFDKILYLDFDGVLNTFTYCDDLPEELHINVRSHDRRVRVEACKMFLDPALTASFRGVLERTGAKVIVCSSWRRVLSEDEIREVLAHHGIPLHGITPLHGRKMSDFRDYRVKEIALHVKTLPEMAVWAVLDDQVRESEFPGHVVRPNEGATPADFSRIESILNGD